jgi:hypothetical protein
MALRFLAAPATVAVIVLTVPGSFQQTSWAKDLAPGQADVDTRIGPRRSPNVVIEEPRPPLGVLETEGRNEHRNCRSASVSDSPDGAKTTSGEPQCDR